MVFIVNGEYPGAFRKGFHYLLEKPLGINRSPQIPHVLAEDLVKCLHLANAARSDGHPLSLRPANLTANLC